MKSYMVKMIAVTCLLVGAWGYVSADHELFSATCSDEKFTKSGQYAKNVALILSNVLVETPNTGEMDFKNQTISKPVAFGAGHCFSSVSAASNLTCHECLQNAIDALKPNCTTSVRATSGSSVAGCVIKYDNVPFSAI